MKITEKKKSKIVSQPDSFFRSPRKNLHANRKWNPYQLTISVVGSPKSSVFDEPKPKPRFFALNRTRKSSVSWLLKPNQTKNKPITDSTGDNPTRLYQCFWSRAWKILGSLSPETYCLGYFNSINLPKLDNVFLHIQSTFSITQYCRDDRQV